MIYKRLVRPLLFRAEPEASHERVLVLLERAQRSPFLKNMVGSWCTYHDPRLRVECFGLSFLNPIGLAAGFDKDARVIQILPKLGFGFIEIGTVTARAQSGNPKPRIFRLPQDRALINRLGFNNSGAEAVAERLEQLGKPPVPLGVNIGKSRDVGIDEAVSDYLYSFEKLFRFADYFVVNVSSPNTPGLRQLQDRERLEELLSALAKANEKHGRDLEINQRPILVKIAPDLSWEQLDDILSVAESTRVAGIVATNTTIGRERLGSPGSVVREAGGLSGAPLAKRSNEIITYISQHTEGKLPIIGVGGVFNAEDVFDKLKAGASLVQTYTGFIYEGPSMVKQINRDLMKKLERTGAKNLSEFMEAKEL
ncbi:quinone-dependent dihydroorotate dehydrogenase [Candidatus Acetothermia bacterium]|nr:quinone-dependent dihydroorotate dehydrogenase [Candidatus Acetothermia bacterium]